MKAQQILGQMKVQQALGKPINMIPVKNEDGIVVEWQVDMEAQ